MKAIREKLMGLRVGQSIRWDGKVWEVLGLTRDEGKALCRTGVGLLEAGLPRHTTRRGIGLARGKTFVQDNVRVVTMYAQKAHDFEVL